MPAGELVRLLGWLKNRHIAIWLTFDDGWSEVRACLPVLEKYEQKATLFISPGETLRGNVWTDTAQQLQIDPKVWRSWYAFGERERMECLAKRGHCKTHVQRFGDGEDEAFISLKWKGASEGIRRRLMTVDEIREVARNPLIEIGNHTWSHLSAPHRPREEFLEEVERTQRTLIRWTGKIPCFCAYPFGRGTPELDSELICRNLTPVYTRQGFSTVDTLGEERNMAIEGVSFAENLGRVLMAWPRVGVTL